MFEWLRRWGRRISGDEPQINPASPRGRVAPAATTTPAAPAATIVRQEPIPDRFFKKLENATTVPECVSLFLNTETGSREETAAVEKLLKMNAGLQDWLEVVSRIHPGTAVGARAVERVQSLASSIDDWLEVYRVSGRDEGFAGLRAVAEQRLLEKAGTIDELLKVHRTSEGGSEFEKRCDARLQELARTKEDWIRILQGSPGDLSFRELVIKNITLSLATPMDCARFCDETELSESEKELVADRMDTMTAGFDEWKAIVEGDEVNNVCDELQDRAFDKMVASVGSAATSENLIYLLDKSNDLYGDEEHTKVVDKIRGLTLPFGIWSALYDDAKESGDDEMQELVFGKMLELAPTKDDLLGIRAKVDGDDSDAMEKSLEAIDKLQLTEDEWETILEKHRNDDTELSNLAFKKLLESYEKSDDILDLYVDYRSWLDDNNPDGDISDEMLEKLSKVVTSSERSIIALLTENDDDSSLHDKMEEAGPEGAGQRQEGG